MNEEFLVDDGSNDREYFTIAPNYILNHSTANDQALYMQMKKHAGEHGLCFCSKKTLMKKLGIGHYALEKSLKYLLSKKWISKAGKTEINTKGGQQTVNCYRINDIWKMNIEHYKRGANLEHPGGSNPEGASNLGSKGMLDCLQRGSNPEDKEEPIRQRRSLSL